MAKEGSQLPNAPGDSDAASSGKARDIDLRNLDLFFTPKATTQAVGQAVEQAGSVPPQLPQLRGADPACPPPAAPENVCREAQVVEHVGHILNAGELHGDTELPEALRGIPGMGELHRLLLGVRGLAASLSTGDLEYICRERGFVAGSLKAFQSNLRHLTWQASRIAEGEYHHRVNFMGDFSVAFNKMTEQLNSTISSLTSLSEKYKDLSYHDPLTGYYNRFGFSRHAAGVIESGGCSPQSTIIMCDIDHFKKVNDTYGHQAGDAVLKAFAARIKSLLRSQELCCRYGGEEFLLFLPGTPLETGWFIANRLRAAVEAMLIHFEDQDLKITSSFGICAVAPPPDGMAPDAYLEAAIHAVDENLYKAKTGGRNRVVAPEDFTPPVRPARRESDPAQNTPEPRDALPNAPSTPDTPDIPDMSDASAAPPPAALPAALSDTLPDTLPNADDAARPSPIQNASGVNKDAPFAGIKSMF